MCGNPKDDNMLTSILQCINTIVLRHHEPTNDGQFLIDFQIFCLTFLFFKLLIILFLLFKKKTEIKLKIFLGC